MSRAVARIRAFYGAHPLHLLALVACFALAGYVVTFVAHDPSLPRILIWFGAAVIAHDLVLFPLYALADRSVTTLLPIRPLDRTRAYRSPVVAPLNYLRTPTLASGLLLLIFLPGIIQQGGTTYQAATGQTQQPYLGRWLLLTAALYIVSALIYTARLIHARRIEHGRSNPGPAPPAVEHRPAPEAGLDTTPHQIGVSTALAVVFLLLCAVRGVLRERKR